MTLQRRLVAVMALLLVIGLVVADLVTYASVRSFLYGRADDTLSQDQQVAFNYLTFAASRNEVVSPATLSRRVPTEVYLTILDRSGKVYMVRPSGSSTRPDPAPILTKNLPVQQVPGIHRRHVGRYGRTFRPDPSAFVLGSTGDPDGEYRAVAVTVPQGTLVTSLSLNPTLDTLNSLRNVEIIASLAVLLAMGAIALVVVRRGLRPLRQMAGTADAIASGDLTRRVPEYGERTEMGRLGGALNEMLTQIEGAFDQKSASEERLRQFVADASHELRTPLTSIRGYAELLSRGGFSDAAGRRKALKRIEEEATRMGGLVEDLLLLAELDRGRPLRAVPVELRQLGADAVGDTNAMPHDHVLSLAPGGPVVVTGDPEKLAQVAHNLVRNALAHTPAGTEVRVSAGVEGSMGYIRVSDNGPGIPADESSRVFDRFYQGDKSRKSAGTGLGLAIVRAIAEASGGTAEVSPTPGRGATLTVRIPLDRSGAPPRAGVDGGPGGPAVRPASSTSPSPSPSPSAAPAPSSSPQLH